MACTKERKLRLHNKSEYPKGKVNHGWVQGHARKALASQKDRQMEWDAAQAANRIPVTLKIKGIESLLGNMVAYNVPLTNPYVIRPRKKYMVKR
jgi:hypothetical protein